MPLIFFVLAHFVLFLKMGILIYVLKATWDFIMKKKEEYSARRANHGSYPIWDPAMMKEEIEDFKKQFSAEALQSSMLSPKKDPVITKSQPPEEMKSQGKSQILGGQTQSSCVPNNNNTGMAKVASLEKRTQKQNPPALARDNSLAEATRISTGSQSTQHHAQEMSKGAGVNSPYDPVRQPQWNPPAAMAGGATWVSTLPEATRLSAVARNQSLEDKIQNDPIWRTVIAIVGVSLVSGITIVGAGYTGRVLLKEYRLDRQQERDIKDLKVKHELEQNALDREAKRKAWTPKETQEEKEKMSKRQQSQTKELAKKHEKEDLTILFVKISNEITDPWAIRTLGASLDLSNSKINACFANNKTVQETCNDILHSGFKSRDQLEKALIKSGNRRYIKKVIWPHYNEKPERKRLYHKIEEKVNSSDGEESEIYYDALSYFKLDGH